MYQYSVTLNVQGDTSTNTYEANTAIQAIFLAGAELALKLVDASPVADLLTAFGLRPQDLYNQIKDTIIEGGEESVEWEFGSN